jgi:hypothetical protein
VRTALLTVFTALCLASPLAAQTAREEIEADRNKAGGIYSLYEEPKAVPAPAPKGYKPFYISHFGRHGARHNSADPAFLLNLLDRAAEDGKLTPLGEDVRARYTALYPQLKLREGDLTAVGTAQLEGIARRMMTLYPRVFRKGRTVQAVSSTSPRCLLSMAAFLQGLRSSGWKGDISLDTGNAWMRTVAPHRKANELYVQQRGRIRTEDRAACEADVQRLRDEIDAQAFLSRLFSDREWVRSLGDPHAIMNAFYSLAVSLPCTGLPADFYDLFTPEELYREWQVENLRYYGYFGPSKYFGGTSWAIAAPALEKIISDADEDLRTGTTAARLRFGHDLGLMCLYSLLDLEGWRTVAADPHEVADAWRSYRVPMAGNLQWIFYRNAAGDILVRLRVNEEDASLPVEPAVEGIFYRWEDLRAYCLARCSEARKRIERMPL